MSFRKRNIGLSTGADRATALNSTAQPQQAATAPETNPGIRPSPDDGRPTTSTGSRSLDNLLAGHGGLPIGKTLLIEENGTTDFAGALLRYYAAEGVVQDQKVHVVGMPEQWGRSLPGLIGPADVADEKPAKRKGERMKIAWRYERLGEFGAGVAGSRAPVATTGDQASSAANGDQAQQPAFCHAFDLTKRLTHPSIANITYIPLTRTNEPLFVSIHKRLQAAIAQSPPNTPARDHSAVSSLAKGFDERTSARVTAMITMPLSLFPRSSGLVRWVELLTDGVIELCPFPHSADALATSGAATAGEEPPQGVLKTHRLPVLHERGGGSDQNVGQDWAFTLSRRKFEIKPFSLPPAEGDKEAQEGAGQGGMPKKADLEF
ncbi:PAXNEB protein superfamily [Aspergillus nomiae NRRL 13137]|uniref:Elongator complex protein 4 n=1 Tax=Aspergillus nomiae NRRL (strain ATCC 15546 / NRRL 13137 / CBS 260.88 / M93) TaxID=1509407 RepID=A0A0L1IVC5_ASPN3|nr:PAXNEB protein superfamily [Aspergillus nomiae NRRL 13137]KNG83143.1 PAXNEB protein superfamily [Aspergillus nomiae NRRL 13137]